MLFLAIRQLLSRRWQTLLILLGILLGTAAYVVISGILLGFQSYLLDQLIENEFHIRVAAREEIIQPGSLDQAFLGDRQAWVHWISPPSGRRDDPYIPSPNLWIRRFEQDPRVEAYSPQVIADVLVTRGGFSETGQLIGVEPERQMLVTNIEKYMVEGRFSEIGRTGNRVVMGDGLMERLGARVFDTVLLGSRGGQAVPFQIVGRFRTGINLVDDTTIYGSLTDAQRLQGKLSQITQFAVRLEDVSLAQIVADEWKQAGEEKVESWADANESVLSIFRTQNLTRNFMTISILVVAGFGIYNVLSVLVSQKRREIAILRAMGFTPGDIERLFLVQGILLGVLGGVLGLATGYGICRYLSTLEVTPGRISAPGNRFLVSFATVIYVRAFALGLASALAASFLPARVARKLSPIDLIRTEAG